jgi:hypothetical protein
VPACARCATEPPTDDAGEPVLLGWMVERAGSVVICPACAHRHARDIEGGLDQSWW